MPAQAIAGLIAPGNIDATKQPQVRNPDGTVSTVDSISIDVGGHEVLIPRVTPDGRHLTTPQAIAEFRRTGRNLGTFKDIPSADAYGEALHESEARRIMADQTSTVDWDKAVAQSGGTIVDAPSDRQPSSPQAPSARGSVLGDLAEGAIDATGTTAINLAQAANWLSSMPMDVVRMLAGRMPGGFQPTGRGISDLVLPNASQAMERVKSEFQPQNGTQQVGAALTDAATAALPAGALSRAAQVARALPTLGPFLAAALEGAGSAGIAAAQGQDPTIPAVLGASASALSSAVDTNAVRAANAMDRSATARMTRVMTPKSGRSAGQFYAMANKAAPVIAREPGLMALSSSGLLTRVDNSLNDARAAIDAAENTTPNRRYMSIATKPIDDELAQLQQNLTVKGSKGVSNPTDAWRVQYDKLGRMREEVQALGPRTNYDNLKTLRKAWDDEAARANVYARDPQMLHVKAQGVASKQGATVLRTQLATASPETAAANARFSVLQNAHDALSALQEAEQRSPRKLRAITARLGAGVLGVLSGAATGHAATGAALGSGGVLLGPAIEAALDSGVTTQIAIARQLAKVADALRGNSWGRVETALSQLRLAGQGVAAGGLGLTVDQNDQDSTEQPEQ